MKQKKRIIKVIVAIMLMVTILVSGTATEKSFAKQRNAYMCEVNFNVREFFKSVYTKAMKRVYRIQDAPYRAMIDYAYGMTENLQYEFIGDTILKIVSNKGFLKRNYYEETIFSEEDGGYYVRNEKMAKAVIYFDEDAAAFSLYYRYANDTEPSYVVYRYENKKNPEYSGFFAYNMRGKIEDAYAFGELWAPRYSGALYADSAKCKELIPYINKMMESWDLQYAGPSVIKVANNTAFLNRNYAKKVTYSNDEEWFVANGERMDKEVKYLFGEDEYIALYYRNKKDSKPTYVGYRHYSTMKPGEIDNATFDMNGKLVSWYVPFLAGDWYNNIDWED